MFLHNISCGFYQLAKTLYVLWQKCDMDGWTAFTRNIAYIFSQEQSG